MINEALSAIINLLKLKKDVKKTDLEIDKLEREQKKEKSTIHVASFEDIKKYDPRTRDVFESAERLQRGENLKLSRQRMNAPPPLCASRPPTWWWLIFAFLAAYLVYRCAA
jgi:hypothetical protein